MSILQDHFFQPIPEGCGVETFIRSLLDESSTRNFNKMLEISRFAFQKNKTVIFEKIVIVSPKDLSLSGAHSLPEIVDAGKGNDLYELPLEIAFLLAVCHTKIGERPIFIGTSKLLGVADSPVICLDPDANDCAKFCIDELSEGEEEAGRLFGENSLWMFCGISSFKLDKALW